MQALHGRTDRDPATAATTGIRRWRSRLAACSILAIVVGQMAACKGVSQNLSRGDALAKLQASPDQITGPIAAQTYVPCAQRADYERNNAELLRMWDQLVSEGAAELHRLAIHRGEPVFEVLHQVACDEPDAII